MGHKSIVLVVVLGVLVSAGWGWAASTTLVSVDNAGMQGSGESNYPSISADGRYVVFDSDSALVPEDTNGARDVYVRDTVMGFTQLVGVNGAGEPGDAGSMTGNPQAMSADGRFVVFRGLAADFGAPGYSSVFVRDRVLGTTEVMDVGPAGEGATTPSIAACISADGRFVAMTSYASNLVPGDTNETYDVFVRDRLLGTTERVSVSSTGAQGNLPSGLWGPLVMSPTGRFILFDSQASNLVPGDDNSAVDVFLRDREAGTTELVSVSSLGRLGNHESIPAALSADARFVAFYSQAHDLIAGDVTFCTGLFVRDRVQGYTERIAKAAHSCGCAISEDARFLVFGTCDPDLVGSLTLEEGNVFVWNRVTRAVEWVSVNDLGVQGDFRSFRSAMSADGRYVGFVSGAGNLTATDTNGETFDIFLRDRGPLPQAPRTDFVMVPAYSTIGSPISFQDLSPVTPTSVPTAWLWDFGDDSQSSAQNPTHAYAHAGVYPISLAVGFAGGGEETSTIGGSVVITFPDVPLDSWAAMHILACIKAHMVLGYPSGLYEPTWVVNRDQMAVYIARAIAGGDDHVPTGPAVPHFSDVPTTFWAYKYIEYTTQPDVDVTHGYEDGTYRPAQPLDRAQMAVFAARTTATPMGDASFGSYVPPHGPSFYDVDADHWAYKYIEYCVEHGLVGGYGDGTYHPQDTLTRDQMAVFIARILELP